MEKKLAELEQFFAQKKENQLSYPLDLPSQQIIDAGKLLIIGAKVTNTAPFTNDYYLPVRANNATFNLLGTNESA